MSIRTRLVFSVSAGYGQQKYSEFIRVPSHNLTHQITFYIQSQRDGSFNAFIDDISAKLLIDRKLKIKFEVFQKLINQSAHIHNKGSFHFSDKSSVRTHGNEYILFVTIVDENSKEMSDITAVADESNFGLRSVAFQRIHGDKISTFKHNFSCLTEKFKMSCLTYLDNNNKPILTYKLVSKKKHSIQTGIVSFQHAKLVHSSVKDRKFTFRFNSSECGSSLNEHLVVISMGTTYAFESNHTIVEKVKKIQKTGPAEKISEKIRNIISKAFNILN